MSDAKQIDDVDVDGLSARDRETLNRAERANAEILAARGAMLAETKLETRGDVTLTRTALSYGDGRHAEVVLVFERASKAAPEVTATVTHDGRVKLEGLPAEGLDVATLKQLADELDDAAKRAAQLEPGERDGLPVTDPVVTEDGEPELVTGEAR